MNVSRIIALLSVFCISGLASAQQAPRERIVETLGQGNAANEIAAQDIPLQTGVPTEKILPPPTRPEAPEMPEISIEDDVAQGTAEDYIKVKKQIKVKKTD